MTQDVKAFHENLLQDVVATAASSEELLSRHQAFMEIISELLVDAGEVSTIERSYKKARGLEVSGYSVEDENDLALQLYIFDLDDELRISSISAREIEALVSRLSEFVVKARGGLARSIDEVDEAHAIALFIEEDWEALSTVKFVIVTNRRMIATVANSREVDGKTVGVQVWDIERLFRLATSGLGREPVSIDFATRLGRPLPCLIGPETPDLSVYLTVFPGQFLADLYSEFGSRLLERNVRAFLQVKGAVNKGIRTTILSQPDRFMAYNNGISATASGVNIARDGDGDLSILSIDDLQIVNGGQTTASLSSAVSRDNADLSTVFVQAKITVVNQQSVDGLVPYIAQYSNTQNKVTTADLFANDPFHIDVENFSRTIWAPSVDGVLAQTKWFYERARGQYADELGRAGTQAKQRKFKAMYPSNQKFTKTDLAKYEHSWFQLPHLVSLGAEKNFKHFAVNLAERPLNCDEDYFKQLVAKAILFKAVDRVVDAKKYGGYKINIVAYTIAKLSLETQLMIDLDQIWKQQGISEALRLAIEVLADLVKEEVFRPQGRSRNIGEWTKKIDCWTVVREIPWNPPEDLKRELRHSSGQIIRSATMSKGVEVANPEEIESIDYCVKFGAETWKRLASWGKNTKILQPYQNGIAYGIGKAISDPNKGRPSPKQAAQGVKMMKVALEKGFSITE